LIEQTKRAQVTASQFSGFSALISCPQPLTQFLRLAHVVEFCYIVIHLRGIVNAQNREEAMLTKTLWWQSGRICKLVFLGQSCQSSTPVPPLSCAS